MLAKLKSMERGKIEESFKISGKKGKEGTTFRAGQYAVKLFKATKSEKKISEEAEKQSMAAAFGVAPAVHYVSTTEKFIVMDALKETIVERGKRENWTVLPDEYAAQLYALCKRLDAAGVVQNDGNPLNLMLDGNGRMYIIDYGFAKKITAAVKKKRGSQPNINLTLWHFSRQLRHYRFENNLTERIVNKYMKKWIKEQDSSFVDQELLDEGEGLLGPIGAAPAAVVKAAVVRKKKSPPPAVTPPPMVRKKKPPAVRKKKPPAARKKKPVVTETPAPRKKKTNRVILESDSDDSDDSDWVPDSESSDSDSDDSDSDDSDSDEDRDTSASRRTAPSKKKGQRAHYRQHVQKDTTIEERIRARKKAFKKYKLSKD